MSKALEFASTVARYNPHSAEIQAKVIPLLLNKSKFLPSNQSLNRQVASRSQVTDLSARAPRRLAQVLAGQVAFLQALELAHRGAES